MRLPCFVVSTLFVGLTVLDAGVASSQDYPNRPIRIVTSNVGGGNDFVARLVAPGIASQLGQPVIVDNRPGNLAGEIVSKATPDGYTLLVAGGSFAFGPLLQKMSYDPVQDFSPITITSKEPNILVMHPSVPVKSVRELIALTKAKPGELNYAAGSTGGAAHLAAELFKAMADVNIIRINYKGTGQALADLMGGQVQLMFASAAAAEPHIKSGKLRALAVTSAEPSALFPGLPTVAATGLPGYEAVSITGLFAPAKTPAAVIKRLNQESVRVINQADVKERFFNAGLETVGSSPEQHAAAVKSEVARMGKVIKAAGIRQE